MGLSRRHLLHHGLAAGMFLCLPPSLQAGVSQPAPQGLLLSSVTDEHKQHWWVLSDSEGRPRFRHPLPGRGHGGALHPSRAAAVLMGRRPATFMAVVERLDEEEVRFIDIQANPGRHFYGHAAYSADGHWLYTSENEFRTGRGIISVRDTRADYAVVAEWESGGIGPHEIKLMPDGRTLVIANGGILTHPDQPREKLNIDTMQPSLAYLDTATGDMVQQLELADRQLSIRHLDVTADGQVWFGCQYEGDALDPLPLVYHHRQSQPQLQAAEAPLNIWRSLRHYTGSVVAHPSAGLVGISSPRGDVVTFWNSTDGQYRHSLKLRDVCGLGLSRDGQGFIATTGKGEIALIDAHQLSSIEIHRHPHWLWDNHLLALS